MSVAYGWVLLAGFIASPGPVTSSPHPDPLFLPPAGPAARAEPRVSVWTDRDDPYRRGERARMFVSALGPAYVTVLRVDTDGRVRIVFPRDPWGETHLGPGRNVELAESRGGPGFVVDDDPGIGYLFAIASSGQFDYSEMTRGDYWDYRLLDDGRVEGDPYVALTRLADRITNGGDYDYDIAPYYVDRHYDYPRFVCYDCHSYASYTQWNPYRTSCRRYRMEIYDDPAYYPFRYSRGRGVVADRPANPSPRFVFRDADPSRGWLTRRDGRPSDAGRVYDRGRQAQEIPSPAVGRRPARDESPVRQLLERRRAREAARPGAQRAPLTRARDDTRGDTMSDPSRRSSEPPGLNPMRERPRSTGEPELRRRRRMAR